MRHLAAADGVASKVKISILAVSESDLVLPG